MVISIVRKHTDELRRYLPDACDDICFCDDHKTGNRPLFLARLCSLLELCEKKLEEIFSESVLKSQQPASISTNERGDMNSHSVFDKLTSAPKVKTSQTYLHWVINHLRRIVPETTFCDDNSKKQAIEILETLHDVYRAIELYQDFSTVESFKYLKQQMATREGFLSEFSRHVWKEYYGQLETLQSSDNVLISELVQQLLSCSSLDFRAIIFVRTRMGASILTSILNSHPDLMSRNYKAEFISDI
ncbi:hypothetical protein DICVIV_12894 [Dictyocaulus viviparus]|uniref:Uncharacterized protein n=1 Tax=Dictyocaulus viviparus TaxID=29172 RepID=A0A0D8XFB3_DICVI|nr:hypothetical protein DICVIV_12894 [Dictyocaulus viviparus]